MMNSLKVVVLFFFTTVAFAQGVVINYPQNGASVPTGQDLTVQVVRPDTITGSREVAVVIGLESSANTTLSNAVLPLGSGTLMHNLAGVPIIVVCAKAELIDEGLDIAAGASGMGGMVKGKGGAWEERTDGIMQEVLRTICLKCEFNNASNKSNTEFEI
ncbi:hypothetical protein M378DRAFT_17891 [Amanita muscaria Koide BX008]|uniref:Uncharacterized protein n=1 Tax=Amanita muscaria (strain Koide BX008) TaxID=946122 RepID=A0A0C2WFY9_AMAMK|nr:hypothetical protein M378DRAFT_17891 [Amanita muscaria Koide BX008]